MNIDIKKRIIEALDDFSTKHPIPIRPEFKKDLIQEGLNTFNASNIESCSIEWVRSLYGQEQFKKMFVPPTGSGATGNTSTDYSYYPSLDKNDVLSEPDWNIWKLRPTVTITELSYLSLGHDPKIQDNLMMELSQAENHQSYGIARLICETADNIKERETTIIRNLQKNGGSLPEFRKNLYDQDILLKLTDFVDWLDKEKITYPEELKNCIRIDTDKPNIKKELENTRKVLATVLKIAKDKNSNLTQGHFSDLMSENDKYNTGLSKRTIDGIYAESKKLLK